jgi:hypothetical protein
MMQSNPSYIHRQNVQKQTLDVPVPSRLAGPNTNTEVKPCSISRRIDEQPSDIIEVDPEVV